MNNGDTNIVWGSRVVIVHHRRDHQSSNDSQGCKGSNQTLHEFPQKDSLQFTIIGYQL